MAISHADLVDKLSVVAARAVGGPTLTLATGKGALVAAGSPTADAPMPIIVYRGAAYLTILRCEGVSGDVLTINGTMFGKADAAVNVGDVAYNAPTAGDLKALWDAIAAVETTPGPKGDQGDPGAPGSVWRDGSGAPADSLGVDGDYYLDDATGAVYLKASGAYSQVADITGAQGDQGPAGADGATGPAGVGSFGVSMPAGFAVTNSPLTSSGTIAVSTTLSGILKGTGSGFAAAVPGTDYAPPGGASAYDMRFALAQGSDLATGTNLTGNGVVATHAGTLSKVKIIAKTNGSGGGFTLDIKKNGTTIFSSAPVVAASSTAVNSFTPTTTTFAEDDEFTVDCTAVGGAGIRNVLVTLCGLTAVS
jgi:hypothetical protein